MIYKQFCDEKGRSIPGKEAEFIDALEAEYGVVGHPKAKLLYSKAYEHGHSAGFSEVECFYMDLVELLS